MCLTLTHLINSKLIKFICCVIQIDSRNVVHLGDTSEEHWIAFTYYTWIHVMTVHKDTFKHVKNGYLLCDRGRGYIFSLGGEVAELVFNLRAQEFDGGQSDVCILKVLPDLHSILCF